MLPGDDFLETVIRRIELDRVLPVFLTITVSIRPSIESGLAVMTSLLYDLNSKLLSFFCGLLWDLLRTTLRISASAGFSLEMVTSRSSSGFGESKTV
jgi:hypothetical protein